MLKELVLEKIKQSNELTIDDCKKLIDLGFNKTTTVNDFLIREEFNDLIRVFKALIVYNELVSFLRCNKIVLAIGVSVELPESIL
jgi:hypothetical protein